MICSIVNEPTVSNSCCHDMEFLCYCVQVCTLCIFFAVMSLEVQPVLPAKPLLSPYLYDGLVML